MFRNSMFYLTYRKLKYSYFGDTSPAVASIKVTQRCNLRCKHCTWVNKIVSDLPLERWQQIIDTLYKRGCTVVFIEGGEPTLRADLSQIISYIKRKGMICVLFTNGTRDLAGLNTDAVWISIDGTEKSHDYLRGKATFQKISATLRANPEKNTYSMTTLSKANIDELEDICRELSATSLKGLIFNFMYPYRDILQETLSKEERIACAQRLLKLKHKYPKIVSSDSYFKTVGQPDKLCHPWLLLLVTADGKITQGCTVEPMEERNCEVCDMMCGLEATLGFELKRDSVHFWNKNHIIPKIDYYPDWVLRFLNNDQGKYQKP
jgi:MoaA/NifB/PqqE/SkfB family radical SAM enzyme